jgi:hypothetical protein
VSLHTNVFNISESAGAAEASLDWPVEFISHIKNDGTDDLLIGLDRAITGAPADGLGAPIRLKAGEVLEDLPVQVKKLYYQRGGAVDVAFRALGVS